MSRAGDPYARMVQVMQRQGKVHNGYDMQLAQVLSTEPVSIAVNGLAVDANIHCSKVADAAKDEEAAAILEEEEGISTGLKTLLKELYEDAYVRAGDQVLVQRVGNSFYICGKVVPL